MTPDDERIAVCLDACRGIPSEALKRGVVRKRLDAVRRELAGSRALPPMIDDALRVAIERCRMTHYALGKLADVPPEAIHRFVKTQRDLRLTTAARLARALGLELK